MFFLYIYILFFFCVVLCDTLVVTRFIVSEKLDSTGLDQTFCFFFSKVITNTNNNNIFFPTTVETKLSSLY